MVEVKNLVKRYGDHTAVDDISFTLHEGKIYGLLGPNGAGKSTTMNMMTGYLAPSGGDVVIDGYGIYTDAKKAKQHIGYLPENPPVYPDMTVYEYLKFVAELKGVAKKERLVDVEAVMEETQVLDVADRLIKNLSKGYKQRVGLAGAMLGEPSVMILDEPTVGLDPKQILEFRELIRRLGEDKIILISSHILSEISAVCDHVFIINNGRLIVDDEVANLDSYVKKETVYTITIKGDGEAATTALDALDGVAAVEVQSTGDDGSVVLGVHTEADEDLTEAISLALMEARLPILSMQQQKGSLEQIFLEITEEDDAAVESDESAAEDSSETAAEGTGESTADAPNDVTAGGTDEEAATGDAATSAETASTTAGEGTGTAANDVVDLDESADTTTGETANTAANDVVDSDETADTTTGEAEGTSTSDAATSDESVATQTSETTAAREEGQA